MYGRRRIVKDIYSSSYMSRMFAERVAMNMPLQGTASDIIKIAMNNVYRALKNGGYKSKLILQVHDELIIDSPIEEVEEVSKLLKECMENAAQLSVPLTVDVESGKNWFEC